MSNDEFSTRETDKFVLPTSKDDVELKIEINKLEISEKPKFSGLSKEEVLKFADDPKWVRIRWLLFALFWIIWIGMLVAAILFIVFTPKCAPKPTLAWWQKDCFYQIDVTKFKDSNGDGVGDLEGVTSKLDYLSDLGFKSLFLNQIVNPSVLKELDPKVGTVKNLNSLRKELKNRNMNFVLDIPFDYLKVNGDLEKESKELFDHWLNNYADGVRFLDIKSNQNFMFGDSDTDKIVNKWRSQVDDIGKKNLKEKLIIFDAGNTVDNQKFTAANPSFLINRNLIDINKETLQSPALLIEKLTSYYNSLNNSKPNLMFNTYGSKNLEDLTKVSQILLYLLRGIPVAFYGDEIELGFAGINSDNRYMKWDDTNGCGFTTNQTIGKQLNNDCEQSVKWLTAHGVGDSLMSLITSLTKLRNEPSFLWGEQSFNLNENSVFSFVRNATGFDSYLVALNLIPNSKKVLSNFHEDHVIPLKANITLYYSFTSNHNIAFKPDDQVSTDSILLSYGDVLILKFKN